MRRPIRFAGVVLVALIASASVCADTQVCFVPWKVLEHGASPANKAFVLFWIPSSAEEMRHSELITSQRLTLYAGRCIGMNVVRTDDAELLAKLKAGDALPVALLVEGEKEIARVLSETGALSAAAVEKMVRDAFDTRETALNAMLDQATKKASAGDTGSAIDLLQRVAAQQCAFPRLARTAQRALRRLQK
jgi:hypothetical protein